MRYTFFLFHSWIVHLLFLSVVSLSGVFFNPSCLLLPFFDVLRICGILKYGPWEVEIISLALLTSF